MLTLRKRTCCNHTSSPSSSSCRPSTAIRTAPKIFSGLPWALSGKCIVNLHLHPEHANALSSDISEAFPNGEFSQYFRAEWLTAMCRETRANKEFAQRTQETARWAREQIKRQGGKESPRPELSFEELQELEATPLSFVCGFGAGL